MMLCIFSCYSSEEVKNQNNKHMCILTGLKYCVKHVLNINHTAMYDVKEKLHNLGCTL